MLRQQTARAAHDFTESVVHAVSQSEAEVKNLVREMRIKTTGADAERKRVMQSWEDEIIALQRDMKPLEQLAREVPSMGDVLQCVFATVDAVDEALDRLERRMQAEYGLAPVRVRTGDATGDVSNAAWPKIKTPPPLSSPRALSVAKSGSLAGPPTSFSRSASSNSFKTKPPHLTPRTTGYGPFSGTGRTSNATPKSSTRPALSPKDVEAIPKTPRMEDFGLDANVLRTLQAGNKDYLGEGASSSATNLEAKDLDVSTWDNDDFTAGVEESMRKLGIDLSQNHLTDQYESRRNVALRNLLVTSTPMLKADNGENPDYTQLAAGYSSKADKQQNWKPNRELRFEDTDM